MRPWMIVFSSTIFALTVAAAITLPEVVNAPPSEITPMLLRHLPAFAVATLALYGLGTTLMVTTGLLAGAMQARQDLPPDRRDRVVAFGSNGFRELASKLAGTPTPPGPANGALNAARREITHLHYISLARTHFFSAMIVLAGIAGLGLAQDYASLPFAEGAIPTVSALLVFVGLVLLTVLGRVAIDVATEPLLEAMPQLSVERESQLLRRAVESLEQTSDAIRSGETLALSPAQPDDRVLGVIEQSHHALLDAVDRLSAETQALGSTVQLSAEKIETTIRAAAIQQPPQDDTRSAELQTAIEELTGVLERLAAAPRSADEPALVADLAPHRRQTPPPRLAGELRKLMQEIDAAC
jgi:hypothetical protein